MSSSSDSTTVDEVETSLPPMPLAEMMRRLPTIRPQRRDGMANLIREVGHGEFWTTTRDDQIARMLSRNKAHGVRQTDIATVLGVSDSLVTRIKQRQEERPGEAPRRPGRPSESSDVFPEWKTSSMAKGTLAALSQ